MVGNSVPWKYLKLVRLSAAHQRGLTKVFIEQMDKKELSAEIVECAKKVKLLLMDCDGVLTDGRLYFSSQGEELKVFHVRDGMGLVAWHQEGFISGVITGRESVALEKRTAELNLKYLVQGSKDKVGDFERIISAENLTADMVAFIGDDIPDIPLLKCVGMPIAVADSCESVLPFAKYVTNKNGGLGAVREVVDLLLNVKEYNI